MGTVVSWLLVEETAAATTTEGGAGAAALAALDRAKAVLTRADEVFSTFKPQSPMSRLRRGELTLAAAPPEIAEVLELSRLARTASGGWFDPWRMPGGIDPTGLVKGWAAERALAELRVPGIAGAMINAGGDIAVFGEPEPGQPWRIGVRDPQAAERLLCVVEAPSGSAVATSGTYERGAHVLDPDTGRPARGLVSATVVGPSLAIADALATAIIASGGRALPSVTWLAGYSALAIDREHVAWKTPGFPLTAADEVKVAAA